MYATRGSLRSASMAVGESRAAKPFKAWLYWKRGVTFSVAVISLTALAVLPTVRLNTTMYSPSMALPPSARLISGARLPGSTPLGPVSCDTFFAHPAAISAITAATANALRTETLMGASSTGGGRFSRLRADATAQKICLQYGDVNDLQG